MWKVILAAMKSSYPDCHSVVQNMTVGAHVLYIHVSVADACQKKKRFCAFTKECKCPCSMY